MHDPPHTHTHTSTHTPSHTHTHTPAHMLTHTHTHTHTRLSLWPGFIMALGCVLVAVAQTGEHKAADLILAFVCFVHCAVPGPGDCVAVDL